MIFLRETTEEDIPEIYKYIHADYVKKYCSDKEYEERGRHMKDGTNFLYIQMPIFCLLLQAQRTKVF